MAHRKHRRVRTEPAPGSDPMPASGGLGATDEERPRRDAPASGAAADDERLRRDKPPHY